jgi:hypothetical protein
MEHRPRTECPLGAQVIDLCSASAKTCALELREYRSYDDALPVIPSCEDNEGPHERGMDYAS